MANPQSWFGTDDSSTGVSWLFVEDCSDKGAYTFDKPKPQELAFLQYTSGSTDTPKAVMVTHENIVANSRVIQKCFQNTTESVSVYANRSTGVSSRSRAWALGRYTWAHA